MGETFESETGEANRTDPPDGEATSGPAALSESQDTAAPRAGQPNAAERPSRWPVLAPWAALGAPLVFNLLAVVYDQSQEWGFLGNLWLIFVVAGVGVGTTLWLATWLLLATWRLWWRVFYFATGIACLAAITSPTIPWWEGDWELTIWLAIVTIGVWLPQYLWRCRGWKISLAASNPESAAAGGFSWLRFSIRDLLVLTTGIAVLLTLALSRGALDRFTVALVGAQVVAASLVFWFALAWKSYRAAIGASVLGVVLVSLAGMAASDPPAIFELSTILFILYYAGPATIAALTIVAIVRSAGFRLRRAVS